MSNNPVKSTKEPGEKKPRVWKAWRRTCQDGVPEYFKRVDGQPHGLIVCKRCRVIAVTITERKPEKKHRHRYDRLRCIYNCRSTKPCYHASVEVCQCRKVKP